MERNITPDREVEPGPDDREREDLPDLLRDLTREWSDLLRQEANLARLEIREALATVGKDVVKIGIGIGLAAVGGLALTAFLILVVGALLGDAYWAGALIVGALYLLVGGLLARRALKDLQETHLTPDETIETLKENRRWLKREASDFRREAMH